VKAEEVVNEIINNPALLQKIVDKVYEKLREDVIIKKLNSLEELVKTSNNEIKEKLGEVSKKVDE